MGVQLIGPRFREDLVLDAAEVIEARCPPMTPDRSALSAGTPGRIPQESAACPPQHRTPTSRWPRSSHRGRASAWSSGRRWKRRSASALRQHRLTLLVAPAGYGKTAALTRQIRQLPEGSALAWVCADEDDHLQRFLACLCAALEPYDLPWRVAPDALATLAQGERGLRDVAGELVNALAAAEVPRGLIVLDDLHRMDDPQVFELLQAAARAAARALGRGASPAASTRRCRWRGCAPAASWPNSARTSCASARPRWRRCCAQRPTAAPAPDAQRAAAAHRRAGPPGCA